MADKARKQDIEKYLQRVTQATAQLRRKLSHEKRYKLYGPGALDAFKDELHELAVELSGCASEVQSLIEARYPRDS